MVGTYTHVFDTPVYKGTATVNTGLFINGQWVDPIEQNTIDVVNPATGKTITKVSIGSAKDVDIAFKAAQKAYKSSWGLKCPGVTRGKLLNKLADLLEEHADEFAALESLNTGKVFANSRAQDVGQSIASYAGWADKVHGKTIETTENNPAYTRHEPYGVVGQIIPWNFPLVMLSWKIAPALATGNTIILKPSDITPLTALRIADLINEAGFPPGVVNIINGYGHTVGAAISEHMQISKVAFTGSTLVGRKIMKAAADSNLKVVTLELGGKSPVIVFDDADLDQAVKWSSMGIFNNMRQVCSAGSRIFVQEKVYDEFLTKFTATTRYRAAATGDPFAVGTNHGPQISQAQFERVMGYIDSGKKDGATVIIGGERHGSDGYFIQPTIFADCTPDMKIRKEEIFGPVSVIIKFKDEAEVIEAANDTVYGLACTVFSENITRALRVSHELEAGTAFVNCSLKQSMSPFLSEDTSSLALGESLDNMHSTHIHRLKVSMSISEIDCKIIRYSKKKN